MTGNLGWNPLYLLYQLTTPEMMKQYYLDLDALIKSGIELYHVTSTKLIFKNTK